MQSDIKSISQGEVTPTPEIVSPRPSFDDRAAQNFIPDAAGPMLTDETPMPKSHRGLWAIIAIVVIIALAAVGYFVIYPMMSSPVVEPIVENQPMTPVESAPVLAPHVSALSGSAILIPQVAVKLDTVSREAIVQALTDQGAFVGEGLTEVTFQDTTGGQMPLPTFLTALLPDFLDAQSITTYATDDFTAYIFKDKAGIWPGYIFNLKPEGGATLSQWLASLEKTNLGAFFVTEAGTLGAFKDGTVKGVNDRFATGAIAGASFSYAVTATNLHISTSYEGLKAALGALGY